MRIDRSHFPEEWMQYVYLLDPQHENLLRYAKQVFLRNSSPISLSRFGLIPRVIVMVICMMIVLVLLADFVLRAVAEQQMLATATMEPSYIGCNPLWLFFPICLILFFYLYSDIQSSVYLVFAEIVSRDVVEKEGTPYLVLRLQFTNPFTGEKVEPIQRLSIDHQDRLHQDAFFAVLVMYTPNLGKSGLSGIQRGFFDPGKDSEITPFVL